MPLRINYYVSPEHDLMHRFYIPLTQFQTYANDMEEYILQRQTSTLNNETEMAAACDLDEYKEEWGEDDGDSGWIHFLADRSMDVMQFPNILRSSLLISIYSFLENQLIRLCKEIQIKKSLSLKYNDVNNKGIEKAKLYLSKVVGIDLNPAIKEWNLIKNYQTLRNCFTHSEGMVEEPDKKLLSAIEKIEGVKIYGDNILGKSIFLDGHVIFNFIEIVKSFWGKIEEQYLEILYPHNYWYKK